MNKARHGIVWTARHAWKWLGRFMGDMNASNTMLLAAGIAYFCALAFFPLLTVGLAIASVLITPEQVEAVVSQVNTYLPPDIASLITGQIQAQTGRFGGNIAIALIAIAISLFGASAALENTIRSLNVIYGVKESRNIVHLRLVSIVALVVGLCFMALVIGLLVIDEYMIYLGVPEALVVAVDTIRWPALLLIMITAFTLLYRYGPNRPRIRWRWASWGALAATLIWFVITVGFFAYMRLVPTFGASYALFAGIVVLMIWFNLSALALLIGAHINARIELHTAKSQKHSV